MHIVIARSAAEMDRLRPAWQDLYSSRPYSRFQSFSWNQLAAHAFRDREWPNVVYVENDHGAAIIPAVVTDNGTHIGFLGDALFDYRDVLFSGDAQVLECAWQEIAGLRLPFSVHALRGETHWPLWRDFCPQPFCNAPGVRLEDCSAGQFAAFHPRLGRQMRRLNRQGCRLERYSGNASDLLTWIYRSKAEQMAGDPNNLFADQARIRFIVTVAALEPDLWDIFALQQGNQLVAALVTFLDGDTRRFYTTYYDHMWAHFSPGTALLYEVTRISLAAGFHCDYMTGEQPHKMRLATSHVPLYQVCLSAEELWRSVNPEVAVQPAA